jgi:hypothetical protein
VVALPDALERLRRDLPPGWCAERLGRKFRVWRQWTPGEGLPSVRMVNDDPEVLVRLARAQAPTAAPMVLA